MNTNNDLYTPKGIRIQFNSAIDFQINGSAQTSITVCARPEWEWHCKMARTRCTGNHGWGHWSKHWSILEARIPMIGMGAITLAGRVLPNGKYVSIQPVFQTGVTTAHELAAWFPGISRSTTTLNLSSRQNRGIVPNNSSTAHSVSLTKWSGLAFLNDWRQMLARFTAYKMETYCPVVNLNNVMRSLWLTASTFDITNGYPVIADGRATVIPSIYPMGLTRIIGPLSLLTIPMVWWLHCSIKSNPIGCLWRQWVYL